jgi:hypothetical protein
MNLWMNPSSDDDDDLIAVIDRILSYKAWVVYPTPLYNKLSVIV